jgi:hypothetical protein
MKSTLLLAIILVASVGAIAQAKPSKPAALKFDEFTLESSSYARSESLKFRADRLVKRMRLERGKTLILIGYRSRISEGRGRSAAEIVRDFRWSIGYSALPDDPTVIDGGIREHETIEVWIAPKGAEAPKATPEFTETEAINCPTISIDVRPIGSDGKKFEFVVWFPDANNSDQLKWSVSGGQIAARFLDRVTVTPLSEDSKRVEVFLQVADVPMPCNDRRHATALFGVQPRLFDSFPVVSNGEFRSKMDIFFAELSNNPTDKGVVHTYGSRTNGGRDALARERLIRNHIGFRRFDPSRITFVMAGFREEMQTDFWMVGPGAEDPVPKPTLDKRFVVNTP